MQPLDDKTMSTSEKSPQGDAGGNVAEDARECARRVMELIPAVMRCIRAEMRQQCRNQLSVPQFRPLAYVRRQPGVSLSEVAEHIGVTPYHVEDSHQAG